MHNIYIGFWVTNLLIPGDPDTLAFKTSGGDWEFRKNSRFDEFKAAVVENGQIAETYSIEGVATYSGGRTEAMDALFADLLPICLGASYLTAQSVRPSRGLPHSEIQFVDVGDHFPRERAMGSGFQISRNGSEFGDILERLVSGYGVAGETEKARLLFHHWLDALAFWSLEDLALSTGTVLEVIAATAESVAPSNADVGTFNKNIGYAAQRFGLTTLPPEFRKMRNDLVHEGVLSGSKFPNKDRIACGLAAASALDWIDLYIFAALSQGSPPQTRFAPEGFAGVNCFSL